MAIEAISKPAMTYQGSTSVPETTESPKAVSEKKTNETTANEQVAASVSATGNEMQMNDTLQMNQETIKKAVEEINKNVRNSEAIFGIHDATNRITIKIVDKETKEVVKEYPPEKTLDMIAKVWEMAGLMVDEKR